MRDNGTIQLVGFSVLLSIYLIFVKSPNFGYAELLALIFIGSLMGYWVAKGVK